jgi:hypothetical protein
MSDTVRALVESMVRWRKEEVGIERKGLHRRARGPGLALTSHRHAFDAEGTGSVSERNGDTW